MPPWSVVVGFLTAASDTSPLTLVAAFVAAIGGVSGVLGWHNSAQTRKQAATKDYVSTSLESLSELSAAQAVTIDRLKLENEELRSIEAAQAKEIKTMRVELDKCTRQCEEALGRVKDLEDRP